MGTVRKPSGDTTRTSCPQRSSHATVLESVTTTPLTCGAQASVARRMRKLPSLVVVPNTLRGKRRLAARGLQGRDRLPVDDAQLARFGLHERREALHPVAVVAVEDSLDLADLGLVDVAADHPVE